MTDRTMRWLIRVSILAVIGIMIYFGNNNRKNH